MHHICTIYTIYTIYTIFPIYAIYAVSIGRPHTLTYFWGSKNDYDGGTWGFSSVCCQEMPPQYMYIYDIYIILRFCIYQYTIRFFVNYFYRAYVPCARVLAKFLSRHFRNYEYPTSYTEYRIYWPNEWYIEFSHSHRILMIHLNGLAAP